MSFYATVGKKGSGLDLRLENPAYVRIAPGGVTSWYFGAGIARQ